VSKREVIEVEVEIGTETEIGTGAGNENETEIGNEIGNENDCGEERGRVGFGFFPICRYGYGTYQVIEVIEEEEE